MVRLNKRGMVFVPVFVFLIVLLFGYIFFVSVVKEPADRNYMKIGDVAVDILRTEETSKLQLYFIEKVAEYSAKNSLMDLAENGGGCKDWGDGNCRLIEDLDKNYITYLKKNFNEYLSKLELKGNYDMSLDKKDNKFILYFDSDEIEFIRQPKSPQFVAMSYMINHNFDKEINYDLGIYEELYERYHDLNAQECPFKTKFLSDLKVNVECDDSSEEKYIKFEVTQDLEFIKPVIKFKLRIPEKLKKTGV